MTDKRAHFSSSEQPASNHGRWPRRDPVPAWEGQASADLLQRHLASLEKQLAHADLQLAALRRALDDALIVLEAIDGRGGEALTVLLERRLPKLDPHVLAEVDRLVDDQVQAARLLSPDAFRRGGFHP